MIAFFFVFSLLSLIIVCCESRSETFTKVITNFSQEFLLEVVLLQFYFFSGSSALDTSGKPPDILSYALSEIGLDLSTNNDNLSANNDNLSINNDKSVLNNSKSVLDDSGDTIANDDFIEGHPVNIKELENTLNDRVITSQINNAKCNNNSTTFDTNEVLNNDNVLSTSNSIENIYFDDFGVQETVTIESENNLMVDTVEQQNLLSGETFTNHEINEVVDIADDDEPQPDQCSDESSMPIIKEKVSHLRVKNSKDLFPEHSQSNNILDEIVSLVGSLNGISGTTIGIQESDALNGISGEIESFGNSLNGISGNTNSTQESDALNGISGSTIGTEESEYTYSLNEQSPAVISAYEELLKSIDCPEFSQQELLNTINEEPCDENMPLTASHETTIAPESSIYLPKVLDKDKPQQQKKNYLKQSPKYNHQKKSILKPPNSINMHSGNKQVISVQVSDEKKKPNKTARKRKIKKPQEPMQEKDVDVEIDVENVEQTQEINSKSNLKKCGNAIPNETDTTTLMVAPKFYSFNASSPLTFAAQNALEYFFKYEKFPASTIMAKLSKGLSIQWVSCLSYAF